MLLCVFGCIAVVAGLGPTTMFDLRATRTSDLSRIIALETASYPADEAASPEALTSRLENAGEYFRTMVEGDEIIGFICGTRCDEFTEESMAQHDPTGKYLAIHSVVVAGERRREGLASLALRWYADEMKCEMRLIAKAGLLGLYGKVGFRVLGKSKIVHGQDPWFDCAMTGKEMVQIDAFSATAYKGNPAAVVFSQGPVAWMQDVAQENNLAETAFLRRIPEKRNTFHIRWFTPTAEVDLCGHATLASAEALFLTDRLQLDDSETTVTFETNNAGPLYVRKKRNDTWLAMDLPTSDIDPTTPPKSLVAALPGAKILFCGMGPPTTADWVVEVERLADVDVNIDALRGDNDFVVPRGVIVTSRGESSEFDFVSRFFAPAFGIPEDPVTGSAHALLTKYWETKLQKSPLLAKQASRRTGILKVNTLNDRTIVQGQAAFVFQARILLPDASTKSP